MITVRKAESEMELNGLPLKAGDGATALNESKLILKSTGPAQAILFDLS
jgi:hypothetical protein